MCFTLPKKQVVCRRTPGLHPDQRNALQRTDSTFRLPDRVVRETHFSSSKNQPTGRCNRLILERQRESYCPTWQPTHVSQSTFRMTFRPHSRPAASFAFLAVAWPFLLPLLLGASCSRDCASRSTAGSQCSARRTQVARGWAYASDPFCVDRWTFERVRRKRAQEAWKATRPFRGCRGIRAASAFNVHDWLARRFPSLARYVPEQEKIVGSAAQLAKRPAPIWSAAQPS